MTRWRVTWTAVALSTTALITTGNWQDGSTQVAHAQSAAVTMQNFAFQPDPVTIAVGTTLTWTNKDSAPHALNASDGAWSTASMNTGNSASVTFSQAGTFTYYCRIHQRMHGTVIVKSAAFPTSTPPTKPGQSSSPTATAAAPTATPVTIASATAIPAHNSVKGVTVNARERQNRYVFLLKTIRIRVGQSVTWRNQSDAAHAITSSTKVWHIDRKLQVKGQFSFRFRHAGTFRYYCRFHKGMIGRIDVRR